jgi:hypothetical protein
MSGRQYAEALTGVIRSFWARQGKHPHVRVELAYCDASATDSRGHWVVRSDMIGGWPQAGPRPTHGMAGDSKLESPSPLHALPRVLQAGCRIESVRPSNRVWREVGAARG